MAETSAVSLFSPAWDSVSPFFTDLLDFQVLEILLPTAQVKNQVRKRTPVPPVL